MKSTVLLALLLLALPQSILLAETSPPPDFVLTGEMAGANDSFGWSVAPAGDVNGDDVLDLVVGAPTYDGVAGYAGRAYLFYGPITGNLSAANADATVRAQTFGDNLGISVAGAGDVDGDGFDDLIIGARSNDAAGIQAGRAYLFLGPLSGDMTDAQADATFSGSAFEELGISVASAGDLNDDGFSDLVFGAHMFDAGVGRAYVFFGPVSGQHASASADVIITGEFSSDSFGLSVASAGDVDGDGVDDLVVGAPHAPLGFLDPGRAYVFFGPIAGAMSAAAADFILRGETDNDMFGTSVASGDVNGDGLSDVLVGADQIFNSGPGKAYVFYGPLLPSLTIPLPNAILTGERPQDGFGHSVASAGDVDGDGSDDFLIGAWDNGNRAGRAYLFAGPLAGKIAATAAQLIITGAESGDELGQSVASAGDLDGDGRADLFIGAPQFNDGDPGKAYVFLDGVVVAAVENQPAPIGLRIAHTFPNPFRLSTAISYDVPNDGRARLTIHDVLGRVVRTLVDGRERAGTSVAIWDGRNDRGALTPNGIYFCRLEADGLRAARRVALLR